MRAIGIFLAAALLLFSPPAWAALSLTNCAAATGTKTANVSFTGTTAGDGLMLFTADSSGTTPTVSITDTAGFTYSQIACSGTGCTTPYIATTSPATASMFYVAAINTTANTITATWSNNVSMGLAVCEIASSGVNVSLDPNSGNQVSTTSGSSNVTSLTSAAITTTGTADLLVYCIASNSTESGYTAGTNSQGGGSFTIPSSSNNARLACEYQAASAAQSASTVGFSWTGAHVTLGFYVAFQAVASTFKNQNHSQIF